MSNSKISALTSATTPLAGTETLPIVQSGITKKVAVSKLNSFESVFSAYQGSNQTVSNTTTTVINYDTVTIDTTSTYNATTKTWTPTIAGYYLINATVNPGTGTGIVTVGIKIGSANYQNGGVNSIAGTIPFQVSTIVYLDGATAVQSVSYQSSGGNLTYYGTYQSQFCGALLRAA
jgi:hypothetical protein